VAGDATRGAAAASGVDHVAFAVPDLGRGVDLLSGLLGLVVVHRESNEEQGVDEAMLASPDQPAGGTRVQLVCPLTDDSPVGRFLARHGPGLHHVAFTVADVEAAIAGLAAAGVHVVTDGPRRGTGGSRITFVHPRDVDGVLVELVEPPGRRGDSIASVED
jgi:methylmalonyl-CoA/ethylmalonyl-CoA epimerase